MALAMGAAIKDYNALDWACVGTAIVAPLPAVVGVITAVWRQDLGPGGRRPQPTIAALLGNACWLLFGLTEYQEEPFWLNAWGGGIQFVALLTFLCLCTDAQRMQALRLRGVRGPIGKAALHFAVTLGFGISRIQVELYQILCMAAGCVSAGAPLYTILVIAENGDEADELLTPWIYLSFYAVHGFLWFARGMMMFNPFMLFQNLAGFVCSALQLIPRLPDVWRDDEDELDAMRARVGLQQVLPQGPITREPGTVTIVIHTANVPPPPPPPPEDVPPQAASENTPIPPRRSLRLQEQSNPTTRVTRSSATKNQPTSGGESSSKATKTRSSSKRKQ